MVAGLNTIIAAKSRVWFQFDCRFESMSAHGKTLHELRVLLPRFLASDVSVLEDDGRLKIRNVLY